MKKSSIHEGTINCILNGKVVQGYWFDLPPRTYPNCNDYFKYKWNWNKNKWELTEIYEKKRIKKERKEKLTKINEI